MGTGHGKIIVLALAQLCQLLCFRGGKHQGNNLAILSRHALLCPNFLGNLVVYPPPQSVLYSWACHRCILYIYIRRQASPILISIHIHSATYKLAQKKKPMELSRSKNPSAAAAIVLLLIVMNSGTSFHKSHDATIISIIFFI